MGCLPLIVLFMAGTGIGFAVDGRHGALWGAGAGLLLGLLAGTALMRLLRGRGR